MPRACTVCIHPERAEIEAMIVSGTVNREIACKFSIGRMAIERHAASHIAQEIKKSQAAKEEMQALDVASEMVWANQQAHGIYDASLAGDKPQLRTAITALGEIRKQAELWAELEGELNRGTTIELVEHPDWVNLREIIFAALDPWPDARVAVARAIIAAGGQNAHTA